MKGSDNRSYPPLPDIEERVGYNPARFLLVDTDISPLLRGEDRIDALEAWQDAERKTANRESTLRRIQKRINAVEEGRSGFVEYADPPTAAQTPRETAESGSDEQAIADGGAQQPAQNSPDRDDTDDTDTTDETRTCPDCDSEQTATHDIGGKTALWCRNCSDYVKQL